MTELFIEVDSTSDYLAGLYKTEDYLIDEHWNYMFEIDTHKIIDLLPKGITPKESQPGKSLVNFGYMLFDASQIGGRKDAIELTFSIIINPDLSFSMPMPRMSVYDFRIASNCQVFLDHEYEIQKLNGFYLPGLQRQLDDNSQLLKIWDDSGMICELINSNPTPEYKYELATGQYVSQHKDGLYRGVFIWEGIGCEQQLKGDCGKLYSHAFFKEIDMVQLEECYMQMFLPHDGQVLFRSFNPKLC